MDPPPYWRIKIIMATKEQDQQLNVQPQSIEAEQAVLGSMLSSKDAISKALQWVRSHHFYKEAHGTVSYTHLTLPTNREV